MSPNDSTPAAKPTPSTAPVAEAPAPPEARVAAPAPPPPSRPSFLSRMVRFVVVAGLLIGAGVYFYPGIHRSLTTVSTDDAFVNGHVTHVAPRIPETVKEVLVDDNDFVRSGDMLARLDPAMWDIRVQQAKSNLTAEERARDQAVAKAWSGAAAVRAGRFELASAISAVRNQAATLRVAVARLNEAKAAEALASKEAARYAELAERKSVTQEMADVRRTDFEQAQARVRQALGEVHSARVGLEIPDEPAPGHPLDEVPADVDQKHSSVLDALGKFALNLADLGVPTPAYYESPDQFIAELKSRAPDGDIDALIGKIVHEAPVVTSAAAQVQIARDRLAEAELNRSYCEIRAAVDGFVSNRNVNPGDHVAVGQRLMAIRSFQEVWIDCNFKETQLESIRVGQPVELEVDAYPHKVFHGRVTGFSPGTGSSMSLLPAQNATGNFVKIVQRLPVKVELIGGNPPVTPLFIGLSARPHVLIHAQPEGPNAGQRLRGSFPNVPVEPSWPSLNAPSSPRESSEAAPPAR
ncbi:HlyD family secretion protein [Paludisphaera rhizosphaerae]|uniref:HlyD family secretion protein n=1 Tax=Paludisphaera rhizosphaerae TaxID=2711216 RepID=UPI0013ECA7E2|nr:HlyD family secretion protein [Paludisphaera rhizosphaerae]